MGPAGLATEGRRLTFMSEKEGDAGAPPYFSIKLCVVLYLVAALSFSMVVRCSI